MIERAAAMAFAAGAMVFPGGRVDPGDHALAARLGLDPVVGTAAIAAIRETIEEVGIAVGFVRPPDADAIARMRRALSDGAALDPALSDVGAVLDPAALVPFARWRPHHPERRVFDTHFFIAAEPRGAHAQADGGESVMAEWTTAAGMLESARAGHHRIIFPTELNLRRLASFSSFDEACADARAHPVETITPFVETRDGVSHLCIADGLGYRLTAMPLSDVQRG